MTSEPKQFQDIDMNDDPETVRENEEPVMKVEGKTLDNVGGSLAMAKTSFVSMLSPESFKDTTPFAVKYFKVERSGAMHFTEFDDASIAVVRKD